MFLEKDVLLELKFYGKMKFSKNGKINWWELIAIITFIGISLIAAALINEKVTAGFPKWYRFLPTICIVILDIAFKVIKALVQKQNFLQISNQRLNFLNQKRISYKKFEFENVYWFDYSIKTTEDSVTKKLTIFTNDKDISIDLEKFSQSQIDELISTLQKLNLDVRYYDY